MTLDDHSIRPFDFRKPCRLPVEMESRLSKWQDDVCAYAPDILKSLIRTPLHWKRLPLETAYPADALKGCDFVAFRVRYANYDAHTLLALDQSLAKMLVLLMLDGDAEAVPDERPITDVEQALLEMLVQQVLQAFAAVSPEGLPCELQLQSFMAQPRLNLCFPAAHDLVLLPYEINSASSHGRLTWIWQESLSEKIFDGVGIDVAAQKKPSAEVQDVAMRIRFDVTVRLGSAKLHVSELANLREGDVIVLDQRVSETMPAFVDNRCIFRGWPGRVGNRQAFQIESVEQEP